MRLNLLFCGFIGFLTGCGGGSGSVIGNPPAVPTTNPPGLSLMAQVGEKIFNDRRLSGSTRMSCASCHDPGFFHGPPNALPVQVGGQFESEFGVRAAPSLRYLERNPAFSLGSGHPDQLRGGLMADGRANTLAQQARLPFFNPIEMDNLDAADLARKVRASVYADLFARVFGSSVDADTTLMQIQQALQAFQLEDPRFHPYDSKFDLFLAGKVSLSTAEQRGLEVFNDPQRGNCHACHSSSSDDGKPPLFTNFSYAALGVPRNPFIVKNADPAYFDLGLCGPGRGDLNSAQYCGLFRTPGLRNVARRPSFFHNGVMHSLLQVVQFYNTRDTRPELWYPTQGGVALTTNEPGFPRFGLVKTQSIGGQVLKFDDLPLPFQANLNTTAPLDGRAPGSRPAMSDQDMNDLVCFLHTLTDHYQAAAAPPDAACAAN
jgi:cytochrome c peroxidase